MNHVKGSKQYTMKVVPHRPGREAAVKAGILASTLLVAAGGYMGGRWQGEHNQGLLSESQSQLQQAQTEVTALRQQLANVSVGAEVDRQSSEDIRQEIAAYKTQIQQQLEQISFYRNLMAPADGKEGLAIGDLDYAATGNPNEYRFRLKVLQLASKDEAADFEGGWHFKLVGRQNGEVRALDLKDLSSRFDPAQLKLKFKYFQSLTGEVTLPAGFEPDYTELEAKADGRGGASVSKRIKWSAAPALANQSN